MIHVVDFSENDVAGIDLNCGCPKRFSLQDEMGAALLEKQSVLLAILKALVANIALPITCKIRLLYPTKTESSFERTRSLLQQIEATQVSAVGIHCRYRDDRPTVAAQWQLFESLAASISIPAIGNGDLYSRQDMEQYSGTSSFMFARGAQANVSVFRREGMLQVKEVIGEYLKLAVTYDMPFSNCKYVILQMSFPDKEKTAMHTAIATSKSMALLW